MLRDGPGRYGRFARLTLLACTLFGLAIMHTLGHAGPHGHPHDHHLAEAAAAVVPGSMDGVADPGPGCDGACAHAPGPHPHGGPAGWNACLAVLGALATIVLLAMAVARSRRRGPPGSGPVRWALVPRGPPVRPAGLALATASVLRI